MPLPARAQADRAWSVTAERPFENPPGGRGRLRGVVAAPVKRVLRKLMRWYVEPVAAQQRTFNLAILTLVDELTERTAADVERLERRLEALEQRLAAGSTRTERMRIAVCAPQVPFERGGTEIVVESLVEQLRQRDHEVEHVRVPFKWYPGARAAARGARVATPRPGGGSRPPDRPRDRDEVPLVRHSPPEQGRLAGAPVPAGLRPRPHRARAVRRRDVRPCDRAGDPAARSDRRSARRVACSRSRGNVAERLRQSTGLEAEVLVPPPQQLDYRTSDDAGDVHSLRGPPGSIQASRPASRGRGARRLGRRSSWPATGQTATGSSSSRPSVGLDGRVTFAGKVDDRELVDLYATCLAVYYAPIDEDLGLVPYEAFLSEKPVVTTRDAGGPLEVVVDRENGVVCEPAPAAVAEACCLARSEPRAGARLGALRQAKSPSR